ncbi:DnaD/DnaB domain-containing replication protein [Gottschalkia purinilytica]|uniref:DnaD/DnaB domain-containing replication protein n=1 Tax=Gottschalkia purinilytica TaxID=1503 RepID=A0A0L0W6B6_GOTPU|nr:DnaD domain protein [Gottschalkia purinilytica]KNF07022.1 DnaD/DnaB domain-containing replication protein [Gottschalkia purinilytica]
MSFFVETIDMDLGETPIENIFINDFMPMADGTYVKVYLLGFKYAKDNDTTLNITNEVIAKHLNIPLSDVLRAWDFWESKGVINKHPKDSEDEYDYMIEFVNLRHLYIRNNYKHIISNEETGSSNLYTCSAEDLVEANQIPGINDMFNSIDYIIRRPLVPNERKRVLEWIYNYNMNPDIIVKAFFHSMEKKGRRNLSYVEGIVRNWYDSGITNLEALQDYLKSKDEKFYRYERIMKSLGFGFRQPSESEMRVIDKWFDEWKFTIEVILKACENTKKTSNPSVSYIDGILSSWHKDGIKDVSAVKKDEENRSAKKSINSNVRQNQSQNFKTKFHNFEQRTSKYTAEELEKMVLNKRG